MLVVSGELDSVTTPREGERVAEEFPNSEWFEAPNAGHVHSLYNPHGAGRDRDQALSPREHRRLAGKRDYQEF